MCKKSEREHVELQSEPEAVVEVHAAAPEEVAEVEPAASGSSSPEPPPNKKLTGQF